MLSSQIDLEVTESIYEYTYMCVCMRGCVGVCVCVWEEYRKYIKVKMLGYTDKVAIGMIP